MFSNPREADCPQIPPIPIPKRDRTARKVLKSLVNAVARERAAMINKLAIKGHFLRKGSREQSA